MKCAMPRTGRAGAAALAAFAFSIMAAAPAALAEEPGALPPGQIILNPDPPGQMILTPTPPGGAPVSAEEAYGALNDLAPGAGAASEACADDGWQVVVVRGSARAETVRGRLIAVTPRGC